MEKLLQYFIDQTDKRFNQLDQKIDSMHEQLNHLELFKNSIQASARTSSIFVSGITGFITVIFSVVLVPWVKDHLLK